MIEPAESPSALVAAKARPTGMLAIIMVVTMVLVAAVTIVIFLALDDKKLSSETTVEYVTRAEWDGLQQKLAQQETAFNDLRLELAALEQKVTTGAQNTLTQADQYQFGAQLNQLKTSLEQIQTDQQSLRLQTQGYSVSAQDKVAQVLYLNRIQQALWNGLPYAAALESLQCLASQDARLLELLQPLVAGAAQGITSEMQLMQNFRAAVPRWEQALQQKQATDWWERFMLQLRSLVSVRQSQSWSGDPGLNQIGQLLQQRDYKGAATALRNQQPALDTEKLAAQITAYAATLEAVTAIEDHLLTSQKPTETGQP